MVDLITRILLQNAAIHTEVLLIRSSVPLNLPSPVAQTFKDTSWCLPEKLLGAGILYMLY